MLKETLLILLGLMFVSIGVALGEEYTANVIAYEGKADNSTWRSEASALNVSEKWTFSGLVIKYSKLEDSDYVRFVVTGDGVNDDSYNFRLGEGQTKCLRGSCDQNISGSVKLKLVELVLRDASTVAASPSNYSSDSPVYAYATLDSDKLMMTRNGLDADAFDVVAYSQRIAGWTASTKTAKVYVYFKRVDSTPFSVSVTGGKLEPAWEWSSGGGQIKYTLAENTKYTFTVKYDVVNPAGKKEERVDTYALTIKGLASPVGSVIAAIGVYDVVLGNSKTITMSEPGKFTSQSGVSITANGDREFSFSFTSLGQYRVKYTTSSGGESFVDFNVKPEATPTVKAEQEQSKDEGGNDEDGGSTLLLGGLFFGLVGLIGVVIWKRRGKGGTKYVPGGVD